MPTRHQSAVPAQPMAGPAKIGGTGRSLALVVLYVVLVAGLLLTLTWRQSEEIRTAAARETAQA